MSIYLLRFILLEFHSPCQVILLVLEELSAELVFVLLDKEEHITNFVNVSPFSDEYEPIENVPIATCATVYEDPDSGVPYVLVIHQMIFFGDKLKNSLLCLNQLRNMGHRVEDVPRQFDQQSSHGITVFSQDDDDDLFIPLKLDGIISYFDTRKPTPKDLEHAKYYVLTSEETWDPYSV